MGDYIRALERLLDRTDEVYFPGHGGRRRTPTRRQRLSSCIGACASRRSSSASAKATRHRGYRSDRLSGLEPRLLERCRSFVRPTLNTWLSWASCFLRARDSAGRFLPFSTARPRLAAPRRPATPGRSRLCARLDSEESAHARRVRPKSSCRSATRNGIDARASALPSTRMTISSVKPRAWSDLWPRGTPLSRAGLSAARRQRPTQRNLRTVSSSKVEYLLDRALYQPGYAGRDRLASAGRRTSGPG